MAQCDGRVRQAVTAFLLRSFLEANACERGDAEALVTENARYTHAQLLAEARRVARGMLAMGLRHGDHIGILTGNDDFWVKVFYGAALIGCVTVPINTRFKPDEIGFALRQADCRAIFLRESFLKIDFAAAVAEVRPSLPLLRHEIHLARDWPLQQLASEEALSAAMALVLPDDPMLIQFTSGTTAYPKGVLLSHANMLRNAWACAPRLNIVAADRYLNCRPFFHVAGSTLSLLVCLVTGACMVTPPTFEAGAALRLLEQERCTVTSGNDSIFQMLMSHPDFDRRKLQLSKGWAAAGPKVMQRIMQELGIQTLCWAYGLSEASPNVVLSDWREPPELRAAGKARTHEGLDVRIADAETNAVLPPGAAGEIQVRGWSVTRGYYNNSEATAKAFTSDGWLKTGDLGVMDAAGYLSITGRFKDVIRVGGENVAPAEVEEVLLHHPAVNLAQVVGVPDTRLGEVCAAFVTLKAPTTEAALLEWLKPRVANFRFPRHLRIVDSFEPIGMTASGKVQKVKLREHALCVLPLNA